MYWTTPAVNRCINIVLIRVVDLIKYENDIRLLSGSVSMEADYGGCHICLFVIERVFVFVRARMCVYLSE